MAAEAHVRLGRRLGGPHLYNCAACEQNPALKQQLGHDGPPAGLWTENLITNERLERCPLRTLQLAPQTMVAEVRRYTDSHYPAYQEGHLVEEGGMGNQPARYVALIQLTRGYTRLVQAKYDSLNQDDDE